MAYEVTGRRKPTKPKKQARAQKRKRDDVDVHKLDKAVAELDAKATFTKFTDLPLSEPTKAGLKASHFTTLTDIQSRAITLGLKGHDILGAARTGSGKTLAFLIPVLENLYRRQCVGADAGLGAMIISPTRELAIQIFDVLYKIGKHGHLFAAGLLIGGKNLAEEQQALLRMNIVVCTPGRMLQHLSQTATFNVDALQVLVLDEADRILDMGFQRDLDAIIEYLPQDRQTLLFSATQTKKVADLARLSLNNPEYVSVHEAAASATPKTLQQNYTVTPLPKKLDTLWSFIQSAKKSKILVFMSSAKQVRFVFESFRRLQPGIPLLHLHGRQKQTARLDITTRFSKSKHVCLFSTDVAARGLDYPAVDWVVQLDCPEDADTYIHRVGRTARYEHTGRAILLLDPSEEEGMLERLAAKKVPVERINIRERKQMSIRNQLQGLCFKDPELKYLGQKAFASYARSLHLQKDKDIFKLEAYDMEDFAASLGLPGAPRIKFIKGDAQAIKNLKNAPRQRVQESSDSESESEDDDNHDDEPDKHITDQKRKPGDGKVRTKYDRMFERVNQDILADHYTRMIEHNPDSDSGSEQDGSRHKRSKLSADRAPQNFLDEADSSDDGLLKVKRRIPALDDPAHTYISSDDDDPTISHDSRSTRRRNQPGATDSLNGKKIVNERKEAKEVNGIAIDSNRRARALKSRKALARLTSNKPTHMTFDEEADEMVPIVPDFADEHTALGADESERARRRQEFLDTQRAGLRVEDAEDARVAKAKRREKKDKARERARREAEDEDNAGGDGGGEQGMGVMDRPFEDIADLYDDAEEEEDDKRAKSKRKAKTAGQTKAEFTREPQTFEDLEAMAMGVLN